MTELVEGSGIASSDGVVGHRSGLPEASGCPKTGCPRAEASGRVPETFRELLGRGARGLRAVCGRPLGGVFEAVGPSGAAPEGFGGGCPRLRLGRGARGLGRGARGLVSSEGSGGVPGPRAGWPRPRVARGPRAGCPRPRAGCPRVPEASGGVPEGLGRGARGPRAGVP